MKVRRKLSTRVPTLADGDAPTRVASDTRWNLAAHPALSAAGPFVGMAFVGQVFGFPGRSAGRWGPYWASTPLLLLALALILVRRDRLTPVVRMAVAAAYIASAALLVVAQAPGTTGLSLVLLVPIVALAMYGTPVESVLAVLAVTGANLGMSLVRGGSWVVDLRSAVLWAGIGAMVSMTGHRLRGRLRTARRELAYEANTDALTGLLNRRGLESGIAGRSGRRRFAMLSIDVDGLKAVNDTRGHQAGDALLRQVADACRSVLRTGDLIGRMGGDEFAVFVADAALHDALVVCGRIEAAIAATFAGRELSVSLGADAGLPSEDPFAVLARADAAMYANKRSRANRSTMGRTGAAGSF
jgi:diguanylate cyclase